MMIIDCPLVWNDVAGRLASNDDAAAISMTKKVLSMTEPLPDPTLPEFQPQEKAVNIFLTESVGKLPAVLTGAGDPLVLVEQALAQVRIGERQPARKYRRRFLMFDTDRLGQKHDRDRELKKLAKENYLDLVRQDLCFESVLLRHFTGHENASPATSSDALRRLQKKWPNYRKGMAAMELPNALTSFLFGVQPDFHRILTFAS